MLLDLIKFAKMDNADAILFKELQDAGIIIKVSQV